jgi:hypothetical protein
VAVIEEGDGEIQLVQMIAEEKQNKKKKEKKDAKAGPNKPEGAELTCPC